MRKKKKPSISTTVTGESILFVPKGMSYEGKRGPIIVRSGNEAKKSDKGKTPVELVPPQFVGMVAQVLGHGAVKYGRWNWTKGLHWSRTYAATLRHLFLWYCGENLDKESGLSHLSHAATNIMFLITWQEMKRGTDDRPKL